MSGWVDSHCHLFMTEDPAGVIGRAIAAGVEWMMVPGIDLETSLAARALVASDPTHVRWSAGLHPHSASRWTQEAARIEALAVDADAVGECGLDYYRDLSPRRDQLDAFHGQLTLAADLAKPVIVHCRDAFADVYDALAAVDLSAGAVLHCWTGGPRWTRRFRDLPVSFSFAGPITYETGDTVRRGAAAAPRQRTMVETDTPFLTPSPDRSSANEPANVVRVGEALAEVWGVGPGEVARTSTAAAESLFGARP